MTSILPFAFHAFVTGFSVETLYQTSLAMGSMYLEVQACAPIASKTSVHSVNIARESFGGPEYQLAGFNGQYRAGTSDVAILLLSTNDMCEVREVSQLASNGWGRGFLSMWSGGWGALGGGGAMLHVIPPEKSVSKQTE